MRFSEYFPMVRIISLPERRDRRRAVLKELDGIGMRPGRRGVAFFDGLRLTDAAGFPTPGVRGCFLSHMEVLREAEALGHEAVLIIEDDLCVSPQLETIFEEAQTALDGIEWGIAYFGYKESETINSRAGMQNNMQLVAANEPVGCAHFYAVHRRILPQLLEFLLALQQRLPGHASGGPMHYDGALTTFRLQNPSVITLLVVPPIGFQRSSRSDIHSHWFERVAGLRQAADTARHVRSWFRPIPHHDRTA